jgi:Helix-turn-helix.
MDVQNPYWYKLTDEQRRGVILCLLDLGLSLSDIARAAGVDPSTVHAWKVGRAAPQIDKLERLYTSMPEAVERCLPEPPVSEFEVLQAVGVIARAMRSRALRELAVRELQKILPGGLKAEIAYRVEHEDLELFKGRLKAEGISSGTVSYYVSYLVDFLNAVGWVLTPENLQKVYSLYAETPRKMGKTIEALKKFIDTVVRVREPQTASLLYDSFKTVRRRPKNSFKVPTLEEVRRVWEEAHKISPCAAAVWGLMAETGVRLDHLLRARFDGLQLDRRRLLLGETEGPKRQPLIFLTEGPPGTCRTSICRGARSSSPVCACRASGCSRVRSTRSTATSRRPGRGRACPGLSRTCFASSTRSGSWTEASTRLILTYCRAAR